MILIDEILVSEAILEEEFVCNLSACKGACCWEGDYGAPLTPEEVETITGIYEDIKPFLSAEGIGNIEQVGCYAHYDGKTKIGTSLLENGACSFMTTDELGIARCGMELAYRAGTSDFIKPISCQLYPIRIAEDKNSGFIALNYDRWDICSAACTLGKQQKIPVYQFVKQGLIRKFGADFFEALTDAANSLITPKGDFLAQ